MREVGPVFFAAQLLANLVVFWIVLGIEAFSREMQIGTYVIVLAVILLIINGPGSQDYGDTTFQELISEVYALAWGWMLTIAMTITGFVVLFLDMMKKPVWFRFVVLLVARSSAFSLNLSTGKALVLPTNRFWLIVNLCVKIISGIIYTKAIVVQSTAVEQKVFVPLNAATIVLVNGITGIAIWRDYEVVNSWVGYGCVFLYLALGCSLLLGDLGLLQETAPDTFRAARPAILLNRQRRLDLLDNLKGLGGKINTEDLAFSDDEDNEDNDEDDEGLDQFDEEVYELSTRLDGNEVESPQNGNKKSPLKSPKTPREDRLSHSGRGSPSNRRNQLSRTNSVRTGKQAWAAIFEAGKAGGSRHSRVKGLTNGTGHVRPPRKKSHWTELRRTINEGIVFDEEEEDLESSTGGANKNWSTLKRKVKSGRNLNSPLNRKSPDPPVKCRSMPDTALMGSANEVRESVGTSPSADTSGASNPWSKLRNKMEESGPLNVATQATTLSASTQANTVETPNADLEANTATAMVTPPPPPETVPAPAPSPVPTPAPAPSPIPEMSTEATILASSRTARTNITSTAPSRAASRWKNLRSSKPDDQRKEDESNSHSQDEEHLL